MNQTRDEKRVEALRSYNVLDTEEELIFDELTETVARLLEVPICLISLVDDKRQWFKSHFGLEARETPREIAFCNHAIEGEGLFTVLDASCDDRFADNPLVVGGPNIRFYAGMPLVTPEGYALGTLCAIDRKPRVLTKFQEMLLKELAGLATGALEVHRRLRSLAKLREDQGVNQERKELLASMVVHDLRSPLGIITMTASWGASMTSSGNDVTEVQADIQEAFGDILAAGTRMQSMLGDILDICLGESGALVPRLAKTDLSEIVRDAARTHRRGAEAKGSAIEFIGADSVVELSIDRLLIERVVANLIDNAIKFSPAKSLVQLELQMTDTGALLVVRDQAATIGVAERLSIFNPHSRGAKAPPGTGYGLGLTFCRLAAEVHGGEIRIAPCESEGNGNEFIVELPLTR